MLIYDRFARRYGWTPQEVRQLSLEELYWFPVVWEAIGDAERQLRDDDD